MFQGGQHVPKDLLKYHVGASDNPHIVRTWALAPRFPGHCVVSRTRSTALIPIRKTTVSTCSLLPVAMQCLQEISSRTACYNPEDAPLARHLLEQFGGDADYVKSMGTLL